jgi:hypothetical protein
MPKIRAIQKGAVKHSTASAARATPGDFTLRDNHDDSCTVLGTDAQGMTLDISTVASLQVESSDPSVVDVDPAAGMTYQIYARKPGTAVITAVVTWADGTVGPFTIADPIVVSGGGTAGLVITHGTPMVR